MNTDPGLSCTTPGSEEVIQKDVIEDDIALDEDEDETQLNAELVIINMCFYFLF